MRWVPADPSHPSAWAEHPGPDSPRQLRTLDCVMFLKMNENIILRNNVIPSNQGTSGWNPIQYV